MINTELKKVPKVLFLRNVFLFDCIDLVQEFEKKIIECDKPVNQNQKYINDAHPIDSDPIPTVFDGLDTWIKQTNLLCWYCCNSFNGPPKFIPVLIEPSSHKKTKSKYIIGVNGICCRWSCCKSLIKEMTNNINEYIEKCNALNYLYYVWNGRYPAHIQEAPSKFLQKKFGGNLSTQEYYELYDNLEQEFNGII